MHITAIKKSFRFFFRSSPALHVLHRFPYKLATFQESLCRRHRRRLTPTDEYGFHSVRSIFSVVVFAGDGILSVCAHSPKVIKSDNTNMWTNHISVFDLVAFVYFFRCFGDKWKKKLYLNAIERKKNLCVLIWVVRQWRKLGTNEMAFFLLCYYHAILSNKEWNRFACDKTFRLHFFFFLSSIRCRRRSSTSSSSNGGNTMHPFFLLAAPISHFIFRVGFSCSLRSSVIWNSYEFGEANGALWCICGNKLMGKNRKNFVFVAPKNLLIYNFRIYISTSPDSRFPKPEKYVCKGACVYTRVVRLYWFNVGAMRAN